jgi:hypothetical protein
MTTDTALEEVPLGDDVEAQAFAKSGIAVKWDIRRGTRVYRGAISCCESFASTMLFIAAVGTVYAFLFTVAAVAGALPSQRGNFTGIDAPK